MLDHPDSLGPVAAQRVKTKFHNACVVRICALTIRPIQQRRLSAISTMITAPLLLNEEERLSALHACQILDSEPQNSYDDLTWLAADIASCPIAAISLLDSKRVWFKSIVGIEAKEIPRDFAICTHAISNNAPLIIPDASHDPLTANNPLVVDGPRIRFFAGYPLCVSGGIPIGALCVIDTKPKEMQPRIDKQLQVLAQQVATNLEMGRTLGQLTQVCKLAEKTHQLKSEFVATMSHEIRTPLTAILGFSDVLSDAISDDSHLASDSSKSYPERALSESIRAIRRNGEHLLSMVNDVLDLAKLESGKLDLDLRSVDPIQLAMDVISVMQNQAFEQGLSLQLRNSANLPTQIWADPMRLRQILINLIGNAIKFTERGGVTVSIENDSHSKTIAFSVEDTGIGLAPNDLAKVLEFQAFYQADSSISRRYGGTGLGLRICKMLSDAMDCKLRFESQLGRGSKATLVVPLATNKRVEQETVPLEQIDFRPAKNVTHRALSTNSTASEALTGLKILIAEDGTDNQRLLKHILGKAGANITIACNGQEAVQTLTGLSETELPDLILMDLEMPVMDGFTAIQEIRKSSPEIPVLALTAHATELFKQRCSAAGFDGYLTKPFERHRLINACATTVHQFEEC